MNEYSPHSPWVFDIVQSFGMIIEKIIKVSIDYDLRMAQEESNLQEAFVICTALDLHGRKSKVAVSES